eukprot:scaffold21797_cov112-Isochrysis_galbana.AAC.2
MILPKKAEIARAHVRFLSHGLLRSSEIRRRRPLYHCRAERLRRHVRKIPRIRVNNPHRLESSPLLLHEASRAFKRGQSLAHADRVWHGDISCPQPALYRQRDGLLHGASDIHAVLGKTVRASPCGGTEAVLAIPCAEFSQCLRSDRLCTIEGATPVIKLYPNQLTILHTPQAEDVAEIGRCREDLVRRVQAGYCFEPRIWMLQKRGRRHQVSAESDNRSEETTADDAHVMVLRQP